MRLNALTPPSGGPSPHSGGRLWIYKSGRCQYIYFGIEELRACVSHDIECPARLRGMLQADEVTNGLLRFRIANPFGLVFFTAVPPSLNAKILGEESLVGPAEVDIPRWISWDDEWDFVGFLNLEADESPQETPTEGVLLW
ncbi:hypothetical protein FOZ63_031152, partial [Perkinsus olseni]